MAPPITGLNRLVDRLNYNSSTKIWPVSNTAIKNHLQLSHALDDDLVLEVGGYLPAATADVENRANVALIRQKRLQTIDPLLFRKGESVALAVGPVLGNVVVNYLDPSETDQVLPPSSYRVLEDGVYFSDTTPDIADGPGTVWIEYEAGFGNTPAAVPSEWQSIVMQLTFRKYDFRGGDSGQSNDSFERMIEHMIVAAGGSRRGS